MKEHMRWRIARALNRSSRWCWTDLVTWAMRWNTFSDVRSETRCVAQSKECGSCYCGKYLDGIIVTQDR